MVCTKFIVLVLAILLKFDVYLGAPASDRVVCVEQPRDLFLVVDDSASIGHRNIRKVRRFLSSLISSVHVSRDMTRVGFLQFSNEKNTKMRFNLDNNLDAETMQKAFENMEYSGGDKTRTDLALEMVANQVFTKTGGDRPNVPDILVVFTDGNSRIPDRTLAQAQILKDRGVRIIAIGAGYNLHLFKDELENIASTKDDVKMVDFAELDSIVVDIVSKVCRLITTPKPPTQSTQVNRFVPPKTKRPTARLRAPAPSHAFGFITNRLGAITEPALRTTLAPIGCAGSVGKDILFVIDGTVSRQRSLALSEKDFKKIKRFIKWIVRDLSDEKFRVGVMQYSGKDTATMEVDFMNPLEFAEIKLRLGTIVQKRGYKRYTGDALVKANNQFYELDALQHRYDNPNVIVLITRGVSHDRSHAVSEGLTLESRGTRLITVGVGKPGKQLPSFLNQLTHARFVFLSKYHGLRSRREQVLDSMCLKASNNPRPGLPRVSADCRREEHDIFFVIDGSASIKYFNFAKVQIFLMDFISLLRVGASNIHTGLMQFSKRGLTSLVWDLGRYSEFETLMNIRNMKYHAGLRTETGDALTRVNNEIFTGRNGDRPNVPDILILFTDGNAHDIKIARKQAKILKEQKGVLLITIGAGTERTLREFRHELEEMATAPQYALTVNFDELDVFAEKAFPLVCEYLKKRKRL